MADKYDFYLTKLHRLRQIKGARRQPTYLGILRQLQRELQNNIKEPHPYRLVVNSIIDQMKPLMAVSHFNRGASGSSATHRLDYIYHLTSVRKLADQCLEPSKLKWNFFPPGISNTLLPDRRLFESIYHKYVNDYAGSGFMPLTELAIGKYGGKRDFSWWTNLELLATHIVCDAHRLGLPNVWIPKYAIIMRCPSDKVSNRLMNIYLSHVPTVVDGFVSEIFRPADYRAKTPISGETLNLHDLSSFGPPAEEYALNPIDTSLIECYPLLIEKSKRSHHAVHRDARLWQSLEIYYDKL